MKHTYTNQLIHQKSPYLLSHAHNPVNWYPWGKEAFSKAKEQDKPIFLSIGYSTCHWCHVMEQESFEDEDIASLLNQFYISIKVDREERPDIDSVYMSVAQALTGSGGWPLTILMSPDQKPFFAATYLPKESRSNLIGLMDLLSKAAQLWKKDRPRLLKTGQEIQNYLNKPTLHMLPKKEPSLHLLTNGIDLLRRSFDNVYGGFSLAPKFPMPHNILFLLFQARFSKDSAAMACAEKTLIKMYQGGIYDHIGGGFCRYSTDEKWLVPHFEKMLYDNALLAYTYLCAFEATQKKLYLSIVKSILDYVRKELTDPFGGFYCAQDADSEGVEGKYYLFTPKDIEMILGKKESQAFCSWYDITEHGNFEGENIPNLIHNKEYDKSYAKPSQVKWLYDYRRKRYPLHTDKKVITSWTSLMIAAFARSSILLGSSPYLNTALNAAQFIEENLTDKSTGRLWLRWCDGETAYAGHLDDYSFYAFALLELYDATLDVRYLNRCSQIAQHMLQYFFDEKNGGFYLYASDSEVLLSRPKEVYDGAIPSGNSVASLVLCRLAALSGEAYWMDYRDRQLSFVASAIEAYPSGCSFSLLALQTVLYPSTEIICLANTLEDARPLQMLLTKYSSWNQSLLVLTPENQKLLAQFAPFTASYSFVPQKTTYYLCHNGTCSLPVFRLEEVEAYLNA